MLFIAHKNVYWNISLDSIHSLSPIVFENSLSTLFSGFEVCLSTKCGYSLKNQYIFVSEHDDRDRGGATDITIRKSNNNKGQNRRVSFKTGIVSAGRLQLRKGNLEHGLRSQLREDDEQMVDFDPNRASSTFRRRNSPIPRNKAKGLVESGTGWYQVTVSVDSFYSFSRSFQSNWCSLILKIVFSSFRFLTARNTIKTSSWNRY